jgi:PAS domain-containing protein
MNEGDLVDVASAAILLSSDGRYLDASPAALDLLGVGLDELRSMRGADFGVEPRDPAAAEAFRVAWETGGRASLYGVATIRRRDGAQARVRFVIEPRPDEQFVAKLQRVDEPVAAPSRVFTLGDVLAEWRSAERRLASVPADSDEARAIAAHVEELRRRYQETFESRRRDRSS